MERVRRFPVNIVSADGMRPGERIAAGYECLAELLIGHAGSSGPWPTSRSTLTPPGRRLRRATGTMAIPRNGIAARSMLTGPFTNATSAMSSSSRTTTPTSRARNRGLCPALASRACSPAPRRSRSAVSHTSSPGCGAGSGSRKLPACQNQCPTRHGTSSW